MTALERNDFNQEGELHACLILELSEFLQSFLVIDLQTDCSIPIAHGSKLEPQNILIVVLTQLLVLPSRSLSQLIESTDVLVFVISLYSISKNDMHDFVLPSVIHDQLRSDASFLLHYRLCYH